RLAPRCGIGPRVFSGRPLGRRLRQQHLCQVPAGSQPAGRRNDLSIPRQQVKTMAEIRREPQHHSGVYLSDILFALFKRKWTIILCALLGIIAAAAYYFLFPPVYESQAKLLVRYVLERSAVDPIDGTKPTFPSGNDSDRVIGAEIEILTSWDLAMQVAQAIGPKRLLAPAPVPDSVKRVAEAVGLKQLLPPSGASASETDAAHSI